MRVFALQGLYGMFAKRIETHMHRDAIMRLARVTTCTTEECIRRVEHAAAVIAALGAALTPYHMRGCPVSVWDVAEEMTQ